MTNWILSQLRAVLDRTSGATVVLDPDGVLDEDAITSLAEACRVIRADGWLDLRRAWDLDVRCRSDSQQTLCVSSDEFAAATDLPWDIEHEADEVIRLRWPVPKELRALLRSADPASAQNLIDAAGTHTDVAEIVASAYRVAVGDPGSELKSVVRQRLIPETPTEFWDALAAILATPAARSVAAGRGDLTGLQRLWNEWLRHGHADGADAFTAAPGAVLGLLGAGLLKPAPMRATGLPDWASVGAVDPDPEQLVAELFAVQPPSPTDPTSWIETASWWGQVRAAIAASPAPPDNTESAWRIWEQLDERFRTWLRRSYGSSLLSAAPFAALHQIAPRLARRVDEGAKILLVVIDGIGFAQWHPLRRAASLTVLEATGSLAMIPTLTSVSRQAIFAGALPRDFVQHIDTTRAEERRWRQFWTGRGIANRDISYAKVTGGDADPIPEPRGRVAAVVVNAVDEILHGAEVLGDRQVAVSVDLWARTGFLTNLVGEATRDGYETWITSDHGNLPTLPRPIPGEGQIVEKAGTRVRIYPNAVLRGQAADEGDVWDPPGLPTEDAGYFPLFAPGRSGYHPGGERVCHGGISLDEVIVPVARVSA
ncbi:MAG: BREX-3 system phosphatase PglZ [Acidimicrobiaceae bacterium]|nr:BREX-3 system phosphatase PglZ [Acidimicrobiaceae bacterium]MYE76726.1 BREX-3 system phosphatase PglZ [Acidimicrobiaceae bacterium]MYJ42446.1 BREX-3 system phosphatase PglZ [Acidimicrobiaceae bacterium]